MNIVTEILNHQKSDFGLFLESGIQQGGIFIDSNRFQVIPERIAVNLIPAEQVMGIGVVFHCFLMAALRNEELVILIPDNPVFFSADGKHHFESFFDFIKKLFSAHGYSPS